LFGHVFNWVLCGVLCVQIYVYGYKFPTDGRFLKSLAYFVFLVETVQTALSGANLYYWFVVGFGNVEHLENFHFAPVDIPVLTAVISFIVQGYFCHRIWVLNSRSSRICWVIAMVCIADCSRILQDSNVFLNAGHGDPISRRDMGGHKSRYHICFRQIIFLTQHLAAYG
ncbi:hypothetical protein H4582DRAFT_1819335, partial [Lactarius indigo]